MRTTVLLTGATGALGSVLLERLTRKGYRVICPVRTSPGQHPSERIRGYQRDQVIAIRGDITASQCGVSESDIAQWKNEIDSFIHNAASISFTKPDETNRTNIGGVVNALELAERLGIRQFRHISTAYIAGTADAFTEDDLLIGQQWRNGYEHTKYVGETMVQAWGLNHPDLRYEIYRPSILIGEKDGTTRTWDAYFGYFKPIAQTARTLVSRTTGLPPGAGRTHDGSIGLPIALIASPATTLNLVPISWAADMIASRIGMEAANSRFHFVHSHPPRVQDVIRWSLEALGVSGVSVVGTEQERHSFIALQHPLIRKLQRQVDRILSQYAPYTTHEARFSSVVTSLKMGDDFRAPPAIDRDYLHRLMRYATDSDWGALKTVPAE
ncbi:MAG TPA: SDR family oxidoreductase [Candidatus Paceibacterota bacterium]|nr:SDR family oxidoreductase [Candidatus Paceibacterota bacterium]